MQLVMVHFMCRPERGRRRRESWGSISCVCEDVSRRDERFRPSPKRVDVTQSTEVPDRTRWRRKANSLSLLLSWDSSDTGFQAQITASVSPTPVLSYFGRGLHHTISFPGSLACS